MEEGISFLCKQTEASQTNQVMQYIYPSLMEQNCSDWSNSLWNVWTALPDALLTALHAADDINRRRCAIIDNCVCQLSVGVAILKESLCMPDPADTTRKD